MLATLPALPGWRARPGREYPRVAAARLAGSIAGLSCVVHNWGTSSTFPHFLKFIEGSKVKNIPLLGTN